MEYWESILLGPVWSDASGLKRGRRSATLFSAFAWLIVTVALLLVPQYQHFLIPPSPYSLILGIVLFFALPFAAAQYYRLHILLRPLILLGYLLMFYNLCLSISQSIWRRIDVVPVELPERILDFINARVETVALYLKSLEGFTGSIISVVAGVVYVAFIIIFIVVLAFLLACLIIRFISVMQKIYDSQLQKILRPKEEFY
ncbi:MAG: hypothetical protein Q4P65_00195 [Eubacteriales bacterium]|nr:hypothetical protein [Eubacteriales bacterium]